MTIDKVQQTLKYLPEGVEIKGNAVVVQKFFEALATGADLLGELANYKELEEQGLLLRLPCKVGDTVYVKMASYCDIQYAEAEVRDFTHFTSCGFCVVVTSKHFDKQNIPFSEFGKTVFPTQAEAEQKLKEMESGCNDKCK